MTRTTSCTANYWATTSMTPNNKVNPLSNVAGYLNWNSPLGIGIAKTIILLQATSFGDYCRAPSTPGQINCGKSQTGRTQPINADFRNTFTQPMTWKTSKSMRVAT